MTRSPYNPTLHRLSLLTALATFPLIFIGGLVTSNHAGMSVPDWPNSWGYNMFLFPPSHWVGGILYEHTHRLAGTVVGLLSIILVMNAWAPAQRPRVRRWLGATAFLCFAIAAGLGAGFILFHPQDEQQALKSPLLLGTVGVATVGLLLGIAWLCRRPESRRWVRWLAVAVLIAVCLQGALGGLRVVLSELDLAMAHGCAAQFFFCLIAGMCVVTSRFWIAPHEPISGEARHGRSIKIAAAIALVLVFVQLVIGAVMRHSDAGLAIPDFPLAYGHLLPPTNLDAQFREDAIRRFGTNLGLNRVTLFQIWIHFAHRIGAVLVTAATLTLATLILRRQRKQPALRNLAIILILLLLAQLTLGILTVLLRKPADIASAHVAVGALVLMTTCVTLLRSLRLYSPAPHPRPAEAAVAEEAPSTPVPATA